MIVKENKDVKDNPKASFSFGRWVNGYVEKRKAKSCFDDFAHIEFEVVQIFMDCLGDRSFSCCVNECRIQERRLDCIYQITEN